MESANDERASPTPSLRERQSQRVRDELRAAFVGLVVERGARGFTLHDVAEAAGVSDRTLYRYYASREALIEEVRRASGELIEGARRRRGLVLGPVSIDQPEAVAGAFEAFEEHADTVHAAALLRDSGEVDAAHDARTEGIRQFLHFRGVDRQAVRALTAIVRMLTGSDGWRRLTSPEFGLTSREAGLAAHWAVQVLVAAAREHEGALRPAYDDDTTASRDGRATPTQDDSHDVG